MHIKYLLEQYVEQNAIEIFDRLAQMMIPLLTVNQGNEQKLNDACCTRWRAILWTHHIDAINSYCKNCKAHTPANKYSSKCTFEESFPWRSKTTDHNDTAAD